MAKQDHATKQQHWVPKFYLKNWAQQSDKICCFDKSLKKSFLTNFKNVAGATWFNDIRETRDESNPQTYQMVEKMLADLEGRCGPTFEELQKEAASLAIAYPGEPEEPQSVDTPMRRGDLACFMALQFLRTDDLRATIRKSLTAICQRGMEATVPLVFPGVDPKQYKVVIDENEIKRIHIATFLGFFDFAPHFNEKRWTYGINVHKKPLITSDNPVVKLPMKPLDDGLDSFGMRLIFPLSPLMVLTMYDKKAFPPPWDRRIAFLTEVAVDQYNLLQLQQCRRQIYSNDPNFDFAKHYCEQNPNACVNDANKVGPSGPIVDKIIADLIAAAQGYGKPAH